MLFKLAVFLCLTSVDTTRDKTGTNMGYVFDPVIFFLDTAKRKADGVKKEQRRTKDWDAKKWKKKEVESWVTEWKKKEEKSKDTEKKTRFRVNCGDLVGLRDGHLTMDNWNCGYS